MNSVLRIILIAVILVSTYFFIYWVPFPIADADIPNWLRSSISILIAITVGWFSWKATNTYSSKGLLTSILLGAIILGSIGFFGGFFGPIIFMPEANQGPLVGIFITGPLGFLIGAFGGLVYWLIQVKRERKIEKTV